MRYGTAVHAIYEAWYQGHPDAPRVAAARLGPGNPCTASLRSAGWLAPAAKTAVAGMAHLPRPDRCLAIYTEQPAVLPGAPPIAGTRDLLVHLQPDEQARLGVKLPWLVVDYKTSSAPERYARMPWDLRTDPQGVIYPLAAMIDHDLEAVSCRWLYVPSRSPWIGALPVDFIQRRGAKLDRAVGRLRTRARRALTIVRDPIQATRNPDDCRNYGRLCPHHVDSGGPCDPQEKTMGESLAERIRRQRAEAGYVDPLADAAEPAPEAAPEPKPEPSKRGRGRPPKAAPAAPEPASDNARVEGVVHCVRRTDDGGVLVSVRLPVNECSFTVGSSVTVG